MKIQFMSDLHLEFGDGHGFDLEHTNTSYKDTILVVAGDVYPWNTHTNQYKQFIKTVSELFFHVILVAGNHEFYNGDIEFDTIALNCWCKTFNNVSFLDDDYVKIDDVVFIGSTLWTSFKNFDPIVVSDVVYTMNDFRFIKFCEEVLNEKHVFTLNKISKSFIKRKMEEFINEKIVVVTHHSPVMTTSKYEPSNIDYGYHNTDMIDMIIDWEPDLWIHGHTHESRDFMLGETRILCNPRGYYENSLNKKFDTNMVVEL